MKRVLVVDDSDLIVAQLGDLLVTLGYEVAGSASSGAEAVEQVKLLQPDIVLMDVVMPGEMDGIAAARRIRADHDIPVILVTGNEDEKSIERVTEARAHGYVMKPVRPLELKASIEIALQEKESESRFRDLYREVVENTSDLIYVVDGQGNIKYANEQIVKLGGYTREEAIGKNFASFLTPESLERSAEIFRKNIRREAVGPFELEFFDRDGKVHVIEMSEQLVWEKGTVVEVHGIGRDVTGRKKAEEAIRKNEELMRIILQTSAVGIAFAEDRKISWANAMMLKLFRYTRAEDYLGKDARVLYASEDEYARIGQLVYRGIGFDNVIESDARFRRADGSEFTGHMRISTIDPSNPRHGIIVSVMDATERERAEQKLRRSEEKYRKIFNNSIEGIFQTTPEGRFISANPAFARILGYQSPEEITTDITDIGGQLYVDPDARRKMEELLEKNGIVDDFEVQFRRKDGETIWISLTASIKRGESGEPLYYEGTLVDITEKRKAREEILYLKEFNENIIDNMIDLIDIVDKDHTIVFQNTASRKRYGRGVGRKCYELHYKREAPCDDCTAADTIQEQKCSWRDVLLEDGTCLEIHSSPIKMPDGTYCSMLIMRDITRRKQAEEELRKSEEKFRGVFETSRDFMYTSSLDGKIIDYNVSAKEFFGYSDEEVRNLTILDIFHYPKDRDRIVEKLMAEGFVQNQELKLRKKDGSLIDGLATVTVRKDSSGNIVGFQGTVKDITQMRQMEQQLQQVEKLSGLGTMISGIAHELNNPLTAIMGNAELLSLHKNINDREKKSLDVILQESSRAAKIVGGLLAFAREHRPERRLINVNDVVMESITLREYNLRVNNISVELLLSTDAPPTLADPYQLQQVFTNIINNASDALTEAGGGKLTIITEGREKTLKIVFEDDGPGIEKENLKKLFDPFFTTKDVGKGTGLGLSMAYGIIEEHGGKIEVESEVGRGARFTVELPIHGGEGEGANIEINYVTKAFPGKSVLIVDDEAAVRDFLTDLLLKEGYYVEAACSALDAITLLKATSFDAVVADIRMPGMDGKDLYAHILEKHPDVSKKMLFITGDTLSEETQVFLRTSNTNAITKPFRIDQFLAGLNRIFEE